MNEKFIRFVKDFLYRYEHSPDNVEKIIKAMKKTKPWKVATNLFKANCLRTSQFQLDLALKIALHEMK